MKTSSQTKIFDFNGISVPYKPSQSVTQVLKGVRTPKDIDPIYINNLRKYLETGNSKALSNALLSMTKEACLDLVRSMGFKHHGWEAPIAVSNHVPANSVYIDRRSGRIVINEMQGVARYIDADGDRATLLFNDAKTQAVLVKFPITSHPMILDVCEMESLPEVYHPLTKKMAKALLKEYPIKRLGTNSDETELFYKKHMDARTGLLTNAWNSCDLYESRSFKFDAKLEYIYNSHIDTYTGKTQRSIDIEDNSMKAIRKDVFSFTEAKVLEFGASKALAHHHAWALTSCSGIGTMRELQLSWFDQADLDALMRDVMDLNVDFRDIKPTPDMSEIDIAKEGGNLLKKLINMGLLRTREYKHADPEMPPSIEIWLTLANGTPVALTDVKREDRKEGLTYSYLLAPVWDNATLYKPFEDPENPVLEAYSEPKHKWMHPLNHLAKMILTFDSAIRFESGSHGFSHWFPKNQADWADSKHATKVSMLFKFLQDYCGLYGDPCPATRTPEGIVPSPTAINIIKRSVVIDYGRDMGHEEMYDIAKEAQKTCNFCMVGSKSTNRRVRKYMLANEFGGSILDPKGMSGPHRGACNRSQLMRALKPVKMNVAIVKMDTRTQILITPSGIRKQASSEAFLPQVFNTEEDYHKHLDKFNLIPQDCPATVVEYMTWQAEKRCCWVISPKNSIKIGKLVDQFGNRFMPRHISQCTTILNDVRVDVDLVIPIDELLDKDTHHVLLAHAQEGTLYIDGTEVTAMFVEHTVFRTGAASENVPPRWRWCSFRGLDSYPIWYRLGLIKQVAPRSVDTTFAKALQDARHAILATSPGGGPSEIDPDFLAGKYSSSLSFQSPLP